MEHKGDTVEWCKRRSKVTQGDTEQLVLGEQTGAAVPTRRSRLSLKEKQAKGKLRNKWITRG
jgi:hypothetical protein